MTIATIRFFLLCVLAIFLQVNTLFSYVLYSKEFSISGYDVELDPYYSLIDYYAGLGKTPVPFLGEEEENQIYRYLFKRAFFPKFLLLELSTYPMPWIGVAVKKNYRSLYNDAEVSEGMNLVEVVCSGFEEPAAVSMFLGNMVSFKPKGIKNNMEGKAYMGYLVSAGTYHIKDSELIEDDWVELEWKVKGDRITEKRKMKWSYRIGTKQHSHSDIKDVVYFSVFRDRIDFKEQKKSIFNNSSVEYKIDVDYETLTPVKLFFLLGKSFPRKNKKYTYQLQGGFYIEKKEKYTGSLTRLKEDTFSIMLRPNIKF